MSEYVAKCECEYEECMQVVEICVSINSDKLIGIKHSGDVPRGERPMAWLSFEAARALARELVFLAFQMEMKGKE